MNRTNSLSRALEVISDPWSWLVIKEAFLGTTRFQDFQEHLQIPRQTLIARLTRLADEEIFYKSPVYNRRLLFEYRLSAKGFDIYPVVLAVWRWHRIWHLDPEILPENLYHTVCNQPMVPNLVCTGCREEPVIGSIEAKNLSEDKAELQPATTRRVRIANALAAFGDAHLATLVLGDAWNMLILDAATRNVTQFHELQKYLGISSNVLSVRLKPLVHLGLLSISLNEKDRRIKHYELTKKGQDIYPIILTLTSWGDRWLNGSNGPSQVFIHSPCGTYASYEMVCGTCNQRLFVDEISQAPLTSP